MSARTNDDKLKRVAKMFKIRDSEISHLRDLLAIAEDEQQSIKDTTDKRIKTMQDKEKWLLDEFEDNINGDSLRRKMYDKMLTRYEEVVIWLDMLDEFKCVVKDDPLRLKLYDQMLERREAQCLEKIESLHCLLDTSPKHMSDCNDAVEDECSIDEIYSYCEREGLVLQEETVEANDERMTAMEKQIQELTDCCAKLESRISIDNDKGSDMYPDVHEMYTAMRCLHGHLYQGIHRMSYPQQRKYILFPCSFAGLRCWHDGEGRVFDYTTYEFIGLNERVNPVYAVKYKEKYPDLYNLCISQTSAYTKRSPTSSSWPITPSSNGDSYWTQVLTSPAAIQVQLDENPDMHIKTGVYSYKYKAST